MAQLCRYQDEFEQLNTRVLIVTFGTLPAAEAWLEETGAPFQLLLDPERAVYDAYGLELSLRRSWNLRTIWRYVQLLAGGRPWRGIQGDSAQLGGDFVVDSEGTVQLAYCSHDPTDQLPVTDMLALLSRIEET